MPKTLESPRVRAFLRQLEQDDETTRLAERREAIQELRQIEDGHAARVAPLDSAITKATEARDKAKAALDAAESRLTAAKNTKSSTLWPVDRRRETLLGLLEGDLRPAVLVAALEKVKATHSRLMRATETAEEYRRVTAAIAWCSSAREKLLALQTQDVDLEATIGTVMADVPKTES